MKACGAILVSLLLLVGCGGGSSSTSPRSSDAEISSSSSSSSTSSSSVSSSSSEWPSLTLAPSYAPLAASANSAYAANLYALWKGYHFTTLEAEAVVYPTIAEEFDEVFDSRYLPAGRVVLAAQSGYYKNFCMVDGAAPSSWKLRACTVSDGIGYGMLLALFNADDDAFHRLWNYSRAFRTYSNRELTPRIVYSFHWSPVDENSSTGADLDVATALILMYRKTGNALYLQDALSIASAIWNEEVDKDSHLLAPGNDDRRNGPVHSLGRFSPVALRLFAEVDPSHDWTAVLDAMYAYLQLVQSRGTGVLPNWSKANGDTAASPDGFFDLNGKEAPYLFGKEASFAVWRLAWDWHWFRDSRAGAVLSALNLFISGKANGDPDDAALATLYTWNATAGADNTTATAVPPHLYGAWCATGVAGNMSWLDACTTGLNAKSPQNTASSYFADIALALYSALLNGLFLMPGN